MIRATMIPDRLILIAHLELTIAQKPDDDFEMMRPLRAVTLKSLLSKSNTRNCLLSPQFQLHYRS